MKWIWVVSPTLSRVGHARHRRADLCPIPVRPSPEPQRETSRRAEVAYADDNEISAV